MILLFPVIIHVLLTFLKNMKKQILLLTLVLLGVNLAAPALSMVPRPEYPRPQFERADWVNLNGTWDYIFDLVGSGIERGYEKAISFEGKQTFGSRLY